MNKKALLIPSNNKKEFFLQDCRGYKTPEWGFFGADIKTGDTPLKTVLKVAKVELDLDLKEEDLVHVGEFTQESESESTERSIYVYRSNAAKFTVNNGPGGHWLGQGGCIKRLEEDEKFEDILKAIQALPEA